MKAISSGSLLVRENEALFFRELLESIECQFPYILTMVQEETGTCVPISIPLSQASTWGCHLLTLLAYPAQSERKPWGNGTQEPHWDDSWDRKLVVETDNARTWGIHGRGDPGTWTWPNDHGAQILGYESREEIAQIHEKGNWMVKEFESGRTLVSEDKGLADWLKPRHPRWGILLAPFSKVLDKWMGLVHSRNAD